MDEDRRRTRVQLGPERLELRVSEPPVFPPIGPVLAAPTGPRAAVTDAALNAVTDANYTWLCSPDHAPVEGPPAVAGPPR
ncbi:hypothetical protein ACGFYQ_35355 [Streptomyces sp. NPDC048258]|uniref:hypothetical protein n=1 Tax=Streptomyces sp. NPDC048258 TaxID=3365527 RepID=UPI003715E244